ncbi:UpxY family transcription antiterminator [Aquimarina sp. AU474]|uniref:UpxY family transcription antiterminator n=1 Tax=Aquimarina sp. AU474 TaxID=2108529 RepID=UPI000D69DE5C|nr:UpxY family transcription antiterminator [Aquimarina sp. AU474]
MNLKLNKWYVLYVRSRHEKKVHDLLVENEIEVFVPMIKTIKQWSDRKKKVEEPLFKSYVFVKIKSAKDLHQSLSIDGASAFIRFGHEYAIVKESEIKAIKFIVKDEDLSDLELHNKPYKIGEICKIFYGPLRGLECEILKVNNQSKILVRIDSMMQSIVATMPTCYLQETLESA